MRRLLALSALLLLPLAACIPLDEPADGVAGQDAVEGPLTPVDGVQEFAIVGLKRTTTKGPMIAGTVEEFRLVTTGDWSGEVSWHADVGTLYSDGITASWLVPNVEEARLEVHVATDAGDEETAGFPYTIQTIEADPSYAVSPLAVGQVDSTPDSISDCELAIDSSDVPHVVYRSSTHSQLKYAYFDGAAWQNEVVDGPGFDVGGLVASYYIDMVVDSSGSPHIAYTYSSNQEVRYATPSATGWVREATATSYPYNTSYGQLGIALDPSQGQRPTMIWSYDSGTPEKPVVGYRTGTNSWVEEIYSGAYDEDYATGGIAFDSGGAAWIPYNRSYVAIVRWSDSGGWYGSESIGTFSTANYHPVVLDGSQQPIMMHSTGLEHRVSSSWIHSDFENGSVSPYDIALVGASPRLGLRHGGALEFIEPNSEGYWIYTEIDDMDSTTLSVDTDSSGGTHACYVKSGALWFY
jgi:hypothetical protein